ncbi:unnamed protein product [Mytilus coruscus]|uniref:WSC domain-containing protein n=1 Tax=Mytilus coruscus TaxID=42192 RepID=A0A6J8BUT1_MYTCO|nr:unnamed protein product [Mytilus coruscus]
MSTTGYIYNISCQHKDHISQELSKISELLSSDVFIIIKREVANVFLTRNNYTWTEAKNNCTMIGQENHVNISNSIDRQLWIDARVTYSPWIEYLGIFECFFIMYYRCSRVTDEIVGTHQYVTSGQQIEECLHICTDYDFLGLQQGRCACLKGPPPNTGDSDPKCDSKGCEKDDNGLCVDTNDIGMYAVYSKPVFSRNDIRAGNCLSVVRNDIGGKGVNSYEANPCDQHFHLVCQTDHEPEPKYCGSAKISSNGKLMRSVEKCDKRLPALCLDRPEFVLNPDKGKLIINYHILEKLQ